MMVLLEAKASKSNVFVSLYKGAKSIAAHPTALFALIGVLALVIVLMKVRKAKLDTRSITVIGMAVALTIVLSMFKIFHMPQGGSVTIGSMIPIMLVAYFYGPETGFLAGFIYGILHMMVDPYILHPVQVLFDYPLPAMALGVFGYFNRKGEMDNMTIKIAGVFSAVGLKFLCHFISGVVFFGSYAIEKGQNPYLYSLIYNGSYLLPEAIISSVIMVLIPLYRLKSAIVPKSSGLETSSK